MQREELGRWAQPQRQKQPPPAPLSSRVSQAPQGFGDGSETRPGMAEPLEAPMSFLVRSGKVC